VEPLGIARDDADDLRRHLASVRAADLLVTLGGASMGEGDLMKRTLLDEGMELDFWRVRMRPGSPVSFGRLPRGDAPPLPVLGLPGNPASAFVTFQLLGRPLVRRLGGDDHPHLPVVTATAEDDFGGARDLCQCIRVRLDGPLDQLRARHAGPQGSGLVSSLGPAAGLAVLPEGVERVERGGALRVVLLDPGARGSRQPGYDTRGSGAPP
jgi:molybdopterin molybdotransferase